MLSLDDLDTSDMHCSRTAITGMAAIWLLVLSVPLPAHAQQSQSESRPNVLVILADDLGYSDIGCYGARNQTPYSFLSTPSPRILCHSLTVKLPTERGTQSHGGLVIHVGCGDGKLTAALRLADNCIVQGLDADAKRVETARTAIRVLGLYGPVSVILWSGGKLPYVDNLATLVVCADAGAVPAGEIMRVLRPYGAAMVKRDGKWTVAVKSQLQGTDQWEQHYHGADNNAVAQDVVVGPPRRYQ